MNTVRSLGPALLLTLALLAVPPVAAAQDACPNPVTQVGLLFADIELLVLEFQGLGGRTCTKACKQVGRICLGVAKAHDRCGKTEIKGGGSLLKLACKATGDPRGCNADAKLLLDAEKEAARAALATATGLCAAGASDCQRGCQ